MRRVTTHRSTHQNHSHFCFTTFHRASSRREKSSLTERCDTSRPLQIKTPTDCTKSLSLSLCSQQTSELKWINILELGNRTPSLTRPPVRSLARSLSRSLVRPYVRYVHRGGVNLFGQGRLVLPVCFQESFIRSTQRTTSDGRFEGVSGQEGAEGVVGEEETGAGKVDALAL